VKLATMGRPGFELSVGLEGRLGFQQRRKPFVLGCRTSSVRAFSATRSSWGRKIIQLKEFSGLDDEWKLCNIRVYPIE